MHILICASLRASKFANSRDGSSRWQTGHSSSSATWGGSGGNGLLLAAAMEDEDGPASSIERCLNARYEELDEGTA